MYLPAENMAAYSTQTFRRCLHGALWGLGRPYWTLDCGIGKSAADIQLSLSGDKAKRWSRRSDLN